MFYQNWNYNPNYFNPQAYAQMQAQQYEQSQQKEVYKGVPYKGFFETLKIYRKLHFQAVKRKLELGYIVQVLFL